MKKMKSYRASLLALASVFLTPLAIACDKKPAAEKPVEKSELLSKHETIAIFKGVHFKKCMGRTMLCPDKCGHSGEFATFEIKQYTKYEKPGKYGDPKQTSYRIQISDFDKKALTKSSDGKDITALATLIKSLKSGDEVKLNWNHNYVKSTYANGTSSSSPRRVIQKLEKVEVKKTP